MPNSAASKRRLESKRHNPITDHEIGIVADTMSLPREEVALLIGRSPGMVGAIRRMVRYGDDRKGTTRSGTPRWSDEEDDLIRSLGDNRVSRDELLALFPGRTYAAITYRRSHLGRTARPGIGKRLLIAKTCPRCGRLLAAEWFGINSVNGYNAYCRPCAVEVARVNVDAESRDRRAAERRRQYQEITSQHATKHREEYTEADMKVLADPSLTDFEKALRLRRTYVATASARRSLGLSSSAVKLGALDFGEWTIQAVRDSVQG